MTRLVVLGAGWLGHPLCEQAIEQGWQVQGTRRTPDPDVAFECLLKCVEETVHHGISLEDAWWVCAIPPRASDKESKYLHILEHMLALSKKLSSKGFLLCSSTGVYSPNTGTYSESSTLDSSTLRQQVLVNAEQLVKQSNGKILRLAGLVGPEREPGRFGAGKILRGSALGKVNMVHRQDVIDAIFTVLSQWSLAKNVYNLCNPMHPSRVDYYQQKCLAQGTQVPEFENQDDAARIIDGSAIAELGFVYRHAI